MTHAHLLITIRCRLPWLMYLLLLCPPLPRTLAQPFADVVVWLACWQINYGDGWQRLHIRIDARRLRDDDDDSGGGTPVLLCTGA